jgi:hypothetical protein
VNKDEGKENPSQYVANVVKKIYLADAAFVRTIKGKDTACKGEQSPGEKTIGGKED